MADLLTGIRELYDGLWDASSWQDGLNEICVGLQAHHIITVNPAAGHRDDPLCWGAHVATEHLEALGREAGAIMAIADSMRVGVAMDVSQVVPDREFFGGRIYCDIVRPMGGHYGMAASPFAGSVLAVCRPPSARRFAGAEIRRLQAVLPHLQTNLRLKRHLIDIESRTGALTEVLDELGVGVLIASRSGHTVYANRAADVIQRTMREADGSAPGRRMREIIGRPDGRRHAISRGPLQRPVIVRAVPVSGGAAERLLPNSECRVAVFLRDPDQRERAPRVDLMASLGLTAREASLAELLAQDMTLTDAAAMLGITRENARIHLKRIFSKTETRRQAELVSLILRVTV